MFVWPKHCMAPATVQVVSPECLPLRRFKTLQCWKQYRWILLIDWGYGSLRSPIVEFLVITFVPNR